MGVWVRLQHRKFFGGGGLVAWLSCRCNRKAAAGRKKKATKPTTKRLSTETVEGSALTLEGVDDVEGGDGLSLGVLGVGDGVTDDVLEEDLEDTSGLFVDQTGDSLDTTSTSETTDSWLGDALDVIPKDFSVTLGAAFAESFTSFSTSRHD